ncbi:MAG: hypothetical protein ACJAZE_000256, partial [Halioglobus sp.]
ALSTALNEAARANPESSAVVHYCFIFPLAGLF